MSNAVKIFENPKMWIVSEEAADIFCLIGLVSADISQWQLCHNATYQPLIR